MESIAIYWLAFLAIEGFTIRCKDTAISDRFLRIVMFQSIGLALFDLSSTKSHQTGVVQLYVSAIVTVATTAFHKQLRSLAGKIPQRWHAFVIAGLYVGALSILLVFEGF